MAFKVGDRVKLEADLSDLSVEFAGTVVAAKETVPFLKPNQNPNVLGVLFDNRKNVAIGRRVGEEYVLVVTKCKPI
jgi:hypothetical protein